MSDKPNMRIEHKSDRAFELTRAVLDSIGSGEYKVDEEHKTIELLVSSSHFYDLIEILRLQYLELLGKRAWRLEITIYHINDGSDSEYKIEKYPTEEEPEKRVLHFIFGASAVNHIDDFDELMDILQNYDGTYLIREFNTVAEEEAYMQALEDFDGWDKFSTLESYHDDSEIKEFDKRYEEEMEENDEPEHLDCYAYHVETDRNGKKQIHIDGYCYWNDESYQCVQACGCYISVDELNGDCEKAYNAFDNAKQYQGDITKEKIREYYKDAVVLPFDQVTQDTPDGWYVN